MSALSRWQICGFIFTGIFGSFLHFLYDLSGNSIILAPFSAVNESTWEHMKILFFPMFIFALVESKFIKESFSNFWSAKLSGLLIGLILIPVLFYTYTGILGKSIDLINIAIFFLSAAVAFRLETLLLKNKAALGISEAVALITICLIGLIFAVTTFIQPNIPLFIDSTTGKSGIK